jgi:hypothetical protein
MPDLIRHPVSFWIPAFAGMTIVEYLTAERNIAYTSEPFVSFPSLSSLQFRPWVVRLLGCYRLLTDLSSASKAFPITVISLAGSNGVNFHILPHQSFPSA